jgi:hypothetical protein
MKNLIILLITLLIIYYQLAIQLAIQLEYFNFIDDTISLTLLVYKMIK